MKHRYSIAQALILVWWTLDWVILGTPAGEESGPNDFLLAVVGGLIVLFPLVTPFAAVVVGLFDGLADRDEEIVATMLVGGLAALICFFGLGLPELLQPTSEPVEPRMALLAAMELLMLVELGIAALVRFGRRRRTT